MVKYNKHIINKVSFEINTNSKEKAYYLKDNMAMFVHHELLSMLENYFDSLDQKNPLYSLQLEKLDLEFSLHPNLNFDDFKKEVINNVKQQIEKYIENDNANSDNFKLIKNEEKVVNQFFAFLETGIKAWWNNSKNHLDINYVDINNNEELYTMISNETFAKQLLDTFNKPIARSRFIKQFTDDQILMILKKGLLLKTFLDIKAINKSSNVEKKGNISERNTEYIKTDTIDIQKIKDSIQNYLSKSKLNATQRNLAWDIILLELNNIESYNENKVIIKQKLFYLIYTILKSNLNPENRIYDPKIVVREILVQIQNKSALDTITSLEIEILEIVKRLETLNAEKLRIVNKLENESEIEKSLEAVNIKNTTIENELDKVDTKPNNAVENENQELLKDNSKNITPSEKKPSEVDSLKIEANNNNQKLYNLDANNSQKPTENDSKNTTPLQKKPSEVDLLKIENISINEAENQDSKITKEILTPQEISLHDIEKLINEETIIVETPANYYIENAGLILAHPFLTPLFKNCYLLEKDNTFNDPEVAVHLLHYVATGREQDYEHEMVLEKFLCNVPILQPINRNIALSEEMKNEAHKMLKAVLENWEIIKNSSIDLLRNEYLKRPGKLILTEDNPKIIVERKIQDILLDKITWNLSVIKLAWKNKIIFVEW